ncbi:glycoside hydrolase family 97 protein [Persicobacter psychrovividus]|uniref:Alpha-glucosidase n=1 Tax=Persicobacter psychrovividus TaxID=387638 RepID=A0ABN6LC95_9BACT|nr:alpha-glucosidase [Persicobacter psychrovividus]
MMKKVLFFVACLLACNSLMAEDLMVNSPNKKMRFTLHTGKTLKFSVRAFGRAAIDPTKIDLQVDGKYLGAGAKIANSSIKEHQLSETPVVPVKFETVDNHYNELTVKFKSGIQLIARAYDAGVAYRFVLDKKGSVIINNEVFDFTLPGNPKVFFPTEESLISHYERYYEVFNMKNILAGTFCSLPMLNIVAGDLHVGLTEADLFDYPHLFLESNGKGQLVSKFPHVVKATVAEKGELGDRNEIITEEADYIAKTAGKRSFPWRVFPIAEEAGDLIEGNLVYKLSTPSKIKDTSWIKPGKVAWDWWNANNLYGVDFKAGLNNETYKYYIDFAANNNIPYVILDEGWTKSTTNIKEYAKDINVEELVKYGNERGVGLILWALWGPLNEDIAGTLDLYEKWGVKGIKIDFMQRADQDMVNFYEEVAVLAAERHLLVDYHGAFKPTGMEKTYPNIVNYEGVKGLENNKWSDEVTPTHNVTLPFTRMLAGPLDYTPGAMDNAHAQNYMIRFDRPMAIGTRAHQAAMFVVYEAPLQMMADSPSNYEREQKFTSFIAQMPTTWDETKVISGEVGEHIIIARRHGNDWFLAGMTGAEGMETAVALDFLKDGQYEAEILTDGPNAEMAAIDYLLKTKSVSKADELNIKMVNGGGFAVIFHKK